MVRLTGGWLLFASVAAAIVPHHVDDQQRLVATEASAQLQPSPRKLQGRFLHITGNNDVQYRTSEALLTGSISTDIHPDPFYKEGSDSDRACHHGKGQAGYFGAEVTSCDTPFSLVNATFRWIEKHLKDEVDFVIWTGDSARHDNDEKLPRTDKQVIKLNRFIVDKFVETFGKTDNIGDPDPTNDFVVPIVPTFGNNDILPHNIFTPGPNKWTRVYSDIWDRFVPQAQRHSFARGGWFFTEVIPNKLAVISLNTLYFFDSNSAVDGCDLDTEPGYEHMEWLRTNLQFLRERGMKALLIGHVPPARTESKQSWDETCYQKYTLWMRQYRDVIITSIFGHMNLDHFMFQDVKDLKYDFKIDGVDHGSRGSPKTRPRSSDETFNIAAKSQYLNELRSGWSDLPKPPSNTSSATHARDDPSDSPVEDQKKKHKKKKKKHHKKKKPDPEKAMKKFLKEIGGPWGERYSYSLVSPSVVPNFFPTLRVYEYNITGLEQYHPAREVVGTPVPETTAPCVDDDQISMPMMEDHTDGVEVLSPDGADALKKKKRRKGGKKPPKKSHKPPFPVPKPPSKASPPGPGYSPQPLSLISWIQYYSNLTEIHEKMDGHVATTDPDKFFEYQVEYSTKNDHSYQMNDLTLRSWLDLAERIGRTSLPSADPDVEPHGAPEDDESDAMTTWRRKKKGALKNHLWKVFVKRAFVHTKPDKEIDENFQRY